MIRLSLRTKAVFTALLPILAILCTWSVGTHTTGLAPATLLVAGVFVASLVAVFAGAATFRATSEKISRLIESTTLVSAGVPIRSVEASHDEISQLARAMAEMSRQVIDKELEVRNVSARLDAMLRATTGVCILGEGLDGKITFSNPGAAKLLGLAQGALLGRPLLPTVHAPDEMTSRPGQTDHLLKARGDAMQSAQELETTYIRHDGLPVNVHVTIAPIRDVKGHTLGLLHVANDISARKVLEAELRFKNETLKARTAEQSEIAGKASESLVSLNGAVLGPLLKLSESLKVLRGNLNRAEDQALLTECRSLSARAEEGLRTVMQSVPAPAAVLPMSGNEFLPSLMVLENTRASQDEETNLAAIQDWYKAKGELPSRVEKERGRGKILVVDDFEDTRVLIKAFLHHLNYDLDFAGDGHEALQKIAATNYSVVLMDVEMPGIDGNETARRVREWERERGRTALPLIAITANAAPGKSKAPQWTAFLTKPFTKGLLQAELSKHIPVA